MYWVSPSTDSNYKNWRKIVYIIYNMLYRRYILYIFVIYGYVCLQALESNPSRQELEGTQSFKDTKDLKWVLSHVSTSAFPAEGIFWFRKALGISQAESGNLTGPKITDLPNEMSWEGLGEARFLVKLKICFPFPWFPALTPFPVSSQRHPKPNSYVCGYHVKT